MLGVFGHDILLAGSESEFIGVIDVGLDVLVDWREKFSVGKQRIRGGFVASIGRATTRRIGRATRGLVLILLVVLLVFTGGHGWCRD